MFAWNKNALSKIISSCGTLSDVDTVIDASLPYKKLTRSLDPDFDNEFCDDSPFDEESVDGEKKGLGQSTKKIWIRELNRKNKINFAAIQETKLESMDLFSIKAIWGNFSFDFAFSPSIGFSGGILCVWDPNVFAKDNVTISDSFVAVRTLWEYISHMIASWDGECEILRDFNEVRSDQERFGSIFNEDGTNSFNHFISMAGLIDLPFEGYSFTWAIKSASKMSKLDRFLISEGLLSIYPSLSALCLDRHLSCHRPIIMHKVVVNYGPYPFRVFHFWFYKDGFDKLVEDSWKSLNIDEPNKINLLKKKFQALKVLIKAWCKEDKHCSNASRCTIQSWLSDIDKLLDKGMSNDDLISERTSLLKDFHNLNARLSLDMA
uniref:RNA-directed DNA polymerase, eukaryota n=1 Tax=Tanacetum cinerariifolium TaxID=118510 RepID=A0A6L2MGG8_TANCI|nr:RNA-directed DNA polymerase, eukaryota [Tanacetum cinerariifolium]